MEGQVTISLEAYTQMRDEIQELRKQVEEKTIIKYDNQPSSRLLALIACILIAYFLFYFIKL